MTPLIILKIMNSTMMNTISKRMKIERKSIKQLGKMEQVARYLHNHPQCLTERLMTHIAAYFMNYGYLRMKIKEMYGQIILDNVMKNNFIAISDYSDEKE